MRGAKNKMGRPQNTDPDLTPVVLTTSIPLKFYTMAKQNGWSWSDCLTAGIMLKNAGDDLGFRLKQVEAQNKFLMETVNKMKQQKRIY
jgi:hypothetical protein